MQVTVLWSGEAAEAQGRETTWHNIDWVEEHPDELKLHASDSDHPVVVDRDYVLAYNRTDTE
jgi:hypothetical protein